MDLNNIVNYNTFKKLNEDLSSQFSNSTGFSKSLLGRAIFSLFRFFKQGINMFRLEYYKRQLENEYFAGILRFCINHKEDMPQLLTETTETNIEQDEELNKLMHEVEELYDAAEDDPTIANDIKDRLIKLRDEASAKGQTDLVEYFQNYIDKIDILLSKTTVTESLRGKKFGSLTPTKIKIKEVYGDVLTNEEFAKYDKYSVNWTELAQQMKLNPDLKKEATKLVNKEAIKGIQYGVSKLIFHTVRTPSDMGVNPGRGGGVSQYHNVSRNPELDTNLKRKWDIMISNIMAEFRDVLIVDSTEKDLVINPYRLLSMEESYRIANDGSGDKQFGGGESGRRFLEDKYWIRLNVNNLGLSTETDYVPGDDNNRYGFFSITTMNQTHYYAFDSLPYDAMGQVQHFVYLLNFENIKNTIDEGNSLSNVLNDVNFRENDDVIFGTTDKSLIYDIITNGALKTKSSNKIPIYPFIIRGLKDNSDKIRMLKKDTVKSKELGWESPPGYEISAVGMALQSDPNSNIYTQAVANNMAYVFNVYKIINNSLWGVPKTNNNYIDYLKNTYHIEKFQ